MHRVWAILLVWAFSFSLIAPALAAENRTRVPSCCRKDGKHRCAMTEAPASSGLAVRAPRMQCPWWNLHQAAPVEASVVTTPADSLLIALLVSHPQGVPQTEARQRLAFSRSGCKRGPPASC